MRKTEPLVVVGILICVFVAVFPRYNSYRQDELHQHRPLSAGSTSFTPKIVRVFSTTGSREIETNKANNPGWVFIVYNKSEARRFVATHCPDDLVSFDGVIPMAFKADIFRLCALYTYPGMYSDDDLLYTLPLDSFVKPDGPVVAIEDFRHADFWGYTASRGVLNGFIGTTQRHLSVFMCALIRIRDNVKHKRTTFRTSSQALSITGPQLVEKCMTYPRLLRKTLKGDVADKDGNIVIVHSPFVRPKSSEPHYSKVKYPYHDH